ncbi:MAG: tetratricopeptide repeat protein [Dongiaceae bacterium]
MPIIAVAGYVVQLALILHVVRSGRPYYWIYILLFAPGLGGLAYFIAEILPEMLGTRGARQAMANARQTFNPEGDYRALAEELDTADTVENRRRLAEECLRLGKIEQAITLYKTALTGIHKDDPNLMHGLARAYYAGGDFVNCTQTLEALKAANPKFESADAHLLCARALEGQGRRDEALREYEAVARYFAGAEARCRHALLLRQAGHAQQARQLFEEIVRAVDKTGGPFKRAQREWYDIAKQNLA